MKFPQLKNALLCRILVYVVVLGGFIAPIVIVARIPFIPIEVKVLIGLGFAIGLIIYLVKNFILLMTMDVILGTLHCHNTAGKWVVLPKSFSAQTAEKGLLRFGKAYEPITIFPRPHTLRYKSAFPMTVYSSGIEKVLVTYQTDYLTKDQYHLIFHSAIANARALKGKKKHRFLDRVQKRAPLNCVTVIVIYAERVDEKLRSTLLELVRKNAGDGFETAVLPCVVDLEKGICTFDSERIPYMGYQYPVKNRGIKIIRKYLFHNRLPFGDSLNRLDPMKGVVPEESLWSFWRNMRNEIILDEKKMKMRFGRMNHRDIIYEEDYVYVKWENRGIWVAAERNEELKTVEIDEIRSWTFPKTNKIAKDTVKEVKTLINVYFARLGYTVKYASFDSDSKGEMTVGS